MPLDPVVEQTIRDRFGSSEFARWFGLRIAVIGDGISEVHLDVQPHHLNPGGIVHGGVIAAMLDGAIGLALRTRLGIGSRHVTLQLDVQYISMVKTSHLPVLLVAKGTFVHAGSRAAHGEASLFDAGRRLIARATGTFMTISPITPHVSPDS